MKHYRYGGSTAKRTDACTAWVKLSEGIPNQESAAARDGTCVHYMLECANLQAPFDLQAQFQAELGQVCAETGLTITQDLIDTAKGLWAADCAICDTYKIEYFEAETTGIYGEQIGSTVDKVGRGTTPDGRPMVMLLDYKSGKGVQVEAVGNMQLLHNAMCLRKSSSAGDMFEGVDVIAGVILQPTRDDVYRVKTWEFSTADVDAFEQRHLKQIAAAEAGLGDPVSGSHCAFCPAAATCPAKNGTALRALQRDPVNIELLAGNMAMVQELKTWCASVEKAVYEALEVGSQIDGYKLVAKLARESWIDQEAAIKALGRKAGGKGHITKTTLLTPAQTRKVLKARGHDIDFMAEGLTQKKSSGTTIAPDDDKRDAVLSAQALSAALAAAS